MELAGCWCAMLQAAEYPRHNIVLPIYFKSDSLKNRLEYIEPVSGPMTFKAWFMFMELAKLRPFPLTLVN